MIVCCIDRSAFDDILSRYPAIKSRLLTATMDELDLMRA
jgi:CRP-like cAMP-binding protein